MPPLDTYGLADLIISMSLSIFINVPGLEHIFPFTVTLHSIIKDDAILRDNVCPAMIFSDSRISNRIFFTLSYLHKNKASKENFIQVYQSIYLFCFI